HYSVYEDAHGTHIFATDDLNLLHYAERLALAGVKRWKLDGLFTPGKAFVDIARLFVEARDAIEAGRWSDDWAASQNSRIHELHPVNRTLGDGYFSKQIPSKEA